MYICIYICMYVYVYVVLNTYIYLKDGVWPAVTLDTDPRRGGLLYGPLVDPTIISRSLTGLYIYHIYKKIIMHICIYIHTINMYIYIYIHK
jgi:hypothetical protein